MVQEQSKPKTAAEPRSASKEFVRSGRDIVIQHSIERLADSSSRFSIELPFVSFSFKKNGPNEARDHEKIRDEQMKIVRTLSELQIDPILFDALCRENSTEG